jgi:hypothetical protein
VLGTVSPEWNEHVWAETVILFVLLGLVAVSLGAFVILQRNVPVPVPARARPFVEPRDGDKTRARTKPPRRRG